MEKGKLGLYICSGVASNIMTVSTGYCLCTGNFVGAIICTGTNLLIGGGVAMGALSGTRDQTDYGESSSVTEERYVLVPYEKCFRAGTLVLTENGYKKIEDITEEDVVYSYNMETKTKELKKVVRTFMNDCEEMLTVSVGEVSMNLTPGHTCYVNGEWVLASEIKSGDKLLDCDGNILTVSDVTKTSTCEKVYNFEVEDNHNYFVTNLNILVHNESIGLKGYIKKRL